MLRSALTCELLGAGCVIIKCGSYYKHEAPPPHKRSTTDWPDYQGGTSLRSVEHRISHLGDDRIDLVFVKAHDSHLVSAQDDAYRVSQNLNPEGVIGGVGLATNRTTSDYSADLEYAAMAFNAKNSSVEFLTLGAKSAQRARDIWLCLTKPIPNNSWNEFTSLNPQFPQLVILESKHDH